MGNRNYIRSLILGVSFSRSAGKVLRMDVSEQAAQTTAAILAQLTAEATAHGYTVKSLALAMGQDYNTYRRWVNGERDMPLLMLMQSLQTIGVPSDVFMQRAADRQVRG